MRSLCLLGFANLEYPAEAFEIVDNDKKSRQGRIIRDGEQHLSQKDTMDWFREYQKAHKSIDDSLNET